MGYAGLRWAESRTFPPPPSSSRTVAPSRQLPPSRSHHRGTPAPRTCDLNPNTHPFNGPLPGTTQVSRYQGGNVTSAWWQITLCDPMWHVSSRSGVATVRTAIHLLLTYLLTYQKGKTNLDFTGARNSERQWHQLGHMQICTSLQTDNHANRYSSFLQAGCRSCRPTNSVKALKAMTPTLT